MRHSLAQYVYYCKWCGKSLEDLVDLNQEECQGHEGVYHINYLKIQKEVDRMINPILSRLGL